MKKMFSRKRVLIHIKFHFIQNNKNKKRGNNKKSKNIESKQTEIL